MEGVTFWKTPWAQLAPKVSDQVTSQSTSISENHGKLVAIEDPSVPHIELCNDGSGNTIQLKSTGSI